MPSQATNLPVQSIRKTRKALADTLARLDRENELHWHYREKASLCAANLTKALTELHRAQKTADLALSLIELYERDFHPAIWDDSELTPHRRIKNQLNRLTK